MDWTAVAILSDKVSMVLALRAMATAEVTRTHDVNKHDGFGRVRWYETKRGRATQHERNSDAYPSVAKMASKFQHIERKAPINPTELNTFP